MAGTCFIGGNSYRKSAGYLCAGPAEILKTRTSSPVKTRGTPGNSNTTALKNKLVSYHEHNEHERAEELGKLFISGKNIAVTSDAGTPGICDPALHRAKSHEIDAQVISIPGAAAFVNALVISGCDRFALSSGGFLPSKKGETPARLKE